MKTSGVMMTRAEKAVRDIDTKRVNLPCTYCFDSAHNVMHILLTFSPASREVVIFSIEIHQRPITCGSRAPRPS